jgi:hypothetical protein
MLAKTERLFITPWSKLRTAAQNFGQQMKELAERAKNIVKNFVRLSHFSVHGFRKGSGTHAASATACPPLFVLMAGSKWIKLLGGQIVL